jgi:hypothetical protein
VGYQQCGEQPAQGAAAVVQADLAWAAAGPNSISAGVHQIPTQPTINRSSSPNALMSALTWVQKTKHLF